MKYKNAPSGAKATSAVPRDRLITLLESIDELLKNLYIYDRTKELNAIVTHTRELYSCEAVSLFLVDENDPTRLVLVADAAEPRSGARPGSVCLSIESRPGGGLTGHLAKRGEIIRLHGTKLRGNRYVKEHVTKNLVSGRCHSLLFVPLLDRKGGLIGTVNLHNKKNVRGEPDDRTSFTKQDEEVANILATKVVVLLENSRAFRLFRGLMEDIHSARNHDDILQTILATSTCLLRADRADIALWSQAKGSLVVARRELSETRQNTLWSDVPKGSAIERLWNKSEHTQEKEDILYLPDLTKGRKGAHQTSPARSQMSILLRAYGKPLGVLSLVSFTPDGFDELDAQALKVLARNVSLGIQSIGGHSWLRGRRRVVQTSSPPHADVLNAVLASALELYRLDAGIIFIADHTRRRLYCAAHQDVSRSRQDCPTFTFRFRDKAAAASILRTQQPIYSEDAQQDNRFSKRGLKFFDISGPVVALPLVYENAITGVLTVWNREREGPQEKHIQQLVPFARLVGSLLALRSAEDDQVKLVNELRLLRNRDGSDKHELSQHSLLRLIWIGVHAAGFDRAHVLAFNPESLEFVCTAAYGFADPGAAAGACASTRDNAYADDLARFVLSRPEARVYDPTDPTLYGEDPAAAHYGRHFTSPWAAVPLSLGGELYGAITAHNADTGTQITGENVEFLTGVGGLVSQVLHGRREASRATELAESQSIFQSLVENIPLVMWRKDLDGRFTYVNGLFCNMLKLEQSHVLGRTDFDLFPEGYARRFRQGDEKAIRSRAPFEDDQEPIPLPDGRERYIHVVKRPIIGEAGRIVGTQGIFVDVSEDKFRQLFEHAPLGFHETDEKGDIKHVNLTEQRMLGYSFSEMQGKPLWAFVSPEEHALTREWFREQLARADEERREIAVNLKCKNGRAIPVHITSQGLRDSDGRFVGLLSAVKGLSAGMAVEAALRDPDPRYLDRIKKLPLPVLCKSMDLRFTYGNAAFLKDCGVTTLPEFVGKTDSDLYAREFVRSYHADDRRVLAGEVLDRLELHPSPSCAGLSVVRVIKYPMRDSLRRVVGLQAVFWDFNENENAIALLTRALSEAKEEYRHIVEDAVEGIFESTPEGRFIRANGALVRMLGYDTEEELLGLEDLSFDVFCSAEQRKAYLEAVLHSPNGVKNYEYRAKTKGGARVWFSESARAVRDSEGNVSKLQGFIQDITQRKQDEKKRVLLLELRHRIRNTLRDVSGLILRTQDKLRSSKWDESLVRDCFEQLRHRLHSYSVAHDAFVSEETSTVADAGRFLDGLCDYLNHLHELGERHIALDHSATRFDITSRILIPCSLIITELVSNSARHAFRAQDRGRILVSLHEHQGTSQCELIVQDDGCGMAKRPEIAQMPDHSGLGLVRDLTKQLGGIITPSIGAGTKWVICFPNEQKDGDAW